MKLFQELRIPVIVAPMAGGINNPQLAAAVCEGGGIGSFGFAYSGPEKIQEDLQATKKLTKGPINAIFLFLNQYHSHKKSSLVLLDRLYCN